MPVRHKHRFLFPRAGRLKYLHRVSLLCSPEGAAWQRLPALRAQHKTEIIIPFLCPKQMGFHPLCSSLQPRTRFPLVLCTPSPPTSRLHPQPLVQLLTPGREGEGKGQGSLEKRTGGKLWERDVPRGDGA